MNYALVSKSSLKINHISRNFSDKGPRYLHRHLWSWNLSDSSVKTEMGRVILDDQENETLTEYVLLAELINRTGSPY
jgi:hypothetical protein